MITYLEHYTMKEYNCYSEINKYIMNKITGKPITYKHTDTWVFLLIFLPNETTMPLHTFNLHSHNHDFLVFSTLRGIILHTERSEDISSLRSIKDAFLYSIITAVPIHFQIACKTVTNDEACI